MTQPDFGHDLSCLTDLDPGMIEVDGWTTLAQALARRLQVPRGTLIDDPHYGYDVTGELGDDLSSADVATIGSRIDAEFLKDERVFASQTQVTFLGGVLMTASVITTGVGPFKLVLAISQVTVSLLQATQQ